MRREKQCPIPHLNPQSPCHAFSCYCTLSFLPSPLQELVSDLVPTLQGRSPLITHTAFPWTPPGPICHCVFEDGIVWLLADSVTGLQASWGGTYDQLAPYAPSFLPHPLISPAQPPAEGVECSSYLVSLPSCQGRECQGPT